MLTESEWQTEKETREDWETTLSCVRVRVRVKLAI